MASNRHLGRIVALQALYELELRRQSGDNSAALDDILKRDVERYRSAIDDIAFVEGLASGVVSQQEELDQQLQPIAPEWPITQIARIDRVILRIGLYELLHHQDTVPPRVAINEAIELAKAFGSDNSSRFVNGVLGTAYRKFVEEGSDNAKAEGQQKQV